MYYDNRFAPTVSTDNNLFTSNGKYILREQYVSVGNLRRNALEILTTIHAATTSRSNAM